MSLAENCWAEVADAAESQSDTEIVEIIQKYLDLAADAERGRSMKVHNLKSWTDAFERIWDGRKRHEYRENDRNFEVGDELVLQEYDPAEGRYLDRSLRVKVVDIDKGPAWEIPKNYCVMSISEPYDRQG